MAARISSNPEGMVQMLTPSESGMTGPAAGFGLTSLPQPVPVVGGQSGPSFQQSVAALDLPSQTGFGGMSGNPSDRGPSDRGPSDRSYQRDAGYFQTTEMRASTGYGFGEQGADVDVTVMAYAQWLSEMKQQATNARYQQQAELDLMRDAINANNGELVDFKRHSSQVVHQLQGQVTELRARLSDALAEMAQQSRQRSETEHRINNTVNGLEQKVNARQQEVDASGRTLTEQLERVKGDFDLKVSGVEGSVENLKRALASSQDATIMKFGDLDKALGIFHGNINGTKQELTDTREDWKKSQDLLGQAISTLSQDLADFQKHASTVMNKLQSDAYHFEEIGRDVKDRSHRIEGQLAGLQHSIYDTTNELILLKEDKGLGHAGSTMIRTPQPHPAPAPQHHPGAHQRVVSPRHDSTSIDGSTRFTDRHDSSGDMGLGAGAAAHTSPQAPGLRPPAQPMRSPMAAYPSAPNSGNGSLRSPQPQHPGAAGVPGAGGGPSRSPSGSIVIPTGAVGGMPTRPGGHVSGSSTPMYSPTGVPFAVPGASGRSTTPPQVMRMPGHM